MTFITLTTDFGTADGYVGTMKGVILSIAPAVQLVDLSHDIAPQNIRQGAYVLSRAAPYFPAGTVHLAVIDPGVGSTRLPLLVTTEFAAFVGPDNGLFTFALEQPRAQAWALDRPGYWRADVSRTFHGRDIFAPVAAHLARGAAPADLGRPLTSPVSLSVSNPERKRNGNIRGTVIHVDRFGNLISDIPATWVLDRRWICEIAGRRIAGLSETYATAEPGELIALIGSSGTVEIAVRAGSAAQHLAVGVDQIIELRPILE